MTFCISDKIIHARTFIKRAISPSNKNLRPALVSLATLLALAPSLEGLKAQTNNGQRFDNWRIECRATGVNETDCRILQTLVRQDDRRFLAEISLAVVSVPGETQNRLVLRTPTGMLLTQKPAFRAGDAGVETQMAWWTCGPQACVATVNLSDEQIEALKGSLQMVVAYTVAGQPQPTVIDVSLLGVTAGLDALSKR